MSYNPPPQQPPWGPPPYMPPIPPPSRPGWTRKRVLLPCAALLLFVGIVIGGAGDGTKSGQTVSEKPRPSVTVTTTATTTAEPLPATTVTASAKPAPTVTKTKTVRVTVAPAAAPADDEVTDTSDGSDGSTYYANCTAARAAGAAPIHTGDPGYGRHLDRDGDGVGCE
ncbi:excalibur calcium-binding domain-containing protein [Streptomyces sp. NPDC088341]|uniref:excalibur calcium-binding domain-containing protein n=1 Tax=Streptomyces sp. NPDC088341 TaxID=3154870 RepID=UPI00344822F0